MSQLNPSRLLAVPVLCLWLAGQALAELPVFEEVVGHPLGERVTKTWQMEAYGRALAEASDRVKFEPLGRSVQGRAMMQLIVTSPENHARLDEIQARAQRLGDPRGLSAEEADTILADQPVVFWYGGSIHGFELSGSEAGLKMLERLASADDEDTLRILDQVVLIIDPVLNPDGRDAFGAHNHVRLGREPNADNQDWSNDFTRWEALGFRTSHYFFDLNRDWFAHTHPEIRARLPVFRDWRPQAGIDAHEMGADVEFYFDPPADPIGPFFPDFTSQWFERFAEAHARGFDAAGIDYMTRERFNFFYPAYTTSWLSYQGAVGMLYEQGSSRGLALTRPDGTVRTLADATRNQYLAFEAALGLAAMEREALLRDYLAAHRAAIADGADGNRRYVLPADGAGDPRMLAEVVNLLLRSGVEVQALTESTSLRGLTDRHGASLASRSFPAGSYVIEAAQPRNRLVRVLLEAGITVPEAFLAEARERVERGENPRFYDITAWSLPLLYGIDGYASSDGRTLATRAVVESVAVPGARPPGRAAYAYLIDGAQAAGLPALMHLKAGGHRVAMLTRATRLAGRDYAAGTGIVYAGQAEAHVHEDVRAVAERFELVIDPVDTGLAEGRHPSLGSGDVIYLREPRVAVLAEEPVNAYSFGWAWFTLDQQFELAPTVLRASSLGTVRLADYDTLVIPELTDAEALTRIAGEAALERLAAWVRDGGTLVTLGSASVLPAQLELADIRSWYDEEEHAGAQRVGVPGAMVATQLDRHHWLTAGVPDGFRALVNSDRLLLAPEGPAAPARRPGVRYATGDAFAWSGHLWEESQARLPGALYAYEERVSRGRIIAFAEDPNFRAYYRAANRLFLNAVLAGPSAP